MVGGTASAALRRRQAGGWRRGGRCLGRAEGSPPGSQTWPDESRGAAGFSPQGLLHPSRGSSLLSIRWPPGQHRGGSRGRV